MRGKLITLEGIDGAGKSTHLQWLAERLRGGGRREVVVTREPGGTPLGEKLRALLLHEPMDIGTESLLMFAARQQHLAQVIRPALERGAWVLSDRFTDATFAYQGGGRGMPAAKLEALEAWVQDGLQPDLTLFFDVPVVVGQGRLQAGQADLDRFEREAAQFHERVRAAYLERAARYPARIRIVDSTKAVSDIRKSLEQIVKAL
jgi:dTMP kinase